MNRSSTLLFALGLAALVGTGAPVRAGFVNWSYNWSRVPADVVSADSNGTSRISLTDEPLGHATNSSDIIATNIKTFSTAPRATPNNFLNAAYSLTLRLTDDASGQSGTLTFNGVFNGTLSSSSASITTKFTSPTTGELTLGNSVYTVTLGSYAPPGPPGISNAGSISASVDVRSLVSDPPPPPPPPPTHDTPEPSAVVLGLMGVLFAGVAGWWKYGKRFTLAAA
jgi:hypothetical protein